MSIPNARILIVEDEAIPAEDLRLTLEECGYQVVGKASTGNEAIRLYEDHQPHLVLMDIYLKGDLDGVETIAWLSQRYGDVPVLYLTSYSDQIIRDRAKATNPLGYILKPFDDRTLPLSIEMALNRAESDRMRYESEQWLNTTLRSIGDGVIATDTSGKVKLLNPEAELLTGWTEQDAVGLPLTDVLPVAELKDRDLIEDFRTRSGNLRDQTQKIADTILVNRNGDRLPIDVTISPIVMRGMKCAGAVLAFRDISQRKQFEARLEHIANHDVLTGLPNRLLFSARLQYTLDQMDRLQKKFAVLYIDLDRFKPVNDTHGHECGDHILRSIGRRMKALLRKTDTVARLGGDEFVILLPYISQPDDAAKIAAKVVAALNKPFAYHGEQLVIGASIGVVIYPIDGTSADDLLRVADQNMYVAKRQGGGRYFHPSFQGGPASPDDLPLHMDDVAPPRKRPPQSPSSPFLNRAMSRKPQKSERKAGGKKDDRRASGD